MSRACVLTIMLMLGVIPSTRAQTRPTLEGVVNINTASPDELRLLSGVGPARIRNILAYRQKHPFRTVEELARIKGIGRRTVRQLRLHLAVSGPTTAQKVERQPRCWPSNVRCRARANPATKPSSCSEAAQASPRPDRFAFGLTLQSPA